MPEPKWNLSRLSAGERSALKRNAGVMMQNATMQAIEGFYRAQQQKCNHYSEKAWFASICMECLWREEDHPAIKPLPEILRTVYQNPDASDSEKKRCISYLDLHWADDGFLLGKLCSLIRKLRADHPEIMPDFNALADDLNQWNRADHSVQRRWLNTICQSYDESKKEEETNNAI